jgi:hypothetical protein
VDFYAGHILVGKNDDLVYGPMQAHGPCVWCFKDLAIGLLHPQRGQKRAYRKSGAAQSDTPSISTACVCDGDYKSDHFARGSGITQYSKHRVCLQMLSPLMKGRLRLANEIWTSEAVSLMPGVWTQAGVHSIVSWSCSPVIALEGLRGGSMKKEEIS